MVVTNASCDGVLLECIAEGGDCIEVGIVAVKLCKGVTVDV